MTFGSLFAGIGGLDLGLERAGMMCKWQVENDEWCQRVLRKHWPAVLKFGDVRDCGAHNLTSVDLICGGFPCQDLSYAGKGAGLDGTRSGLWWEFARIIDELRPRYVLVENVPALTRRGLDRVLGALAESGYDASWDHIPASAVGAPHRRDRIFLVAYTNNERLERHRRLVEYPGERFTWQGVEKQDWQEYPARCLGMANGVSNRVHRLRGLGNAVVPQVAEFIGRLICENQED